MGKIEDLIEKVRDFNDPKDRKDLIVELFRSVTRCSEYRCNWMTDNAWLEAMYAKHNVPSTIKITSEDLNNTLARDSRIRHHEIRYVAAPNQLGIYKNKYRMKATHSTTKRLTKEVTAYYATTPGCLPAKPKGNKKWYHEMLETAPKPILTRSRDTTTNLRGRIPAADTLPQQGPKGGSCRKKRKMDSIASDLDVPELEHEKEKVLEEQRTQQQTTTTQQPHRRRSEEIRNESYWESTEARNLFSELGKPDVLLSVLSRIDKLSAAVSSPHGWQSLLDDNEHADECTDCSH